MARVTDVFWPPLPAHLAPTDLVRRWDHAVAAGSLTFFVVFACVALVVSHAFTIPTFGPQHVAVAWLTLGRFPDTYLELTRGQWLPHIMGVVTWGVSIGAAWWVVRRALIPHDHQRHISGHRRLSGPQADIEAQRQAARLRGEQRTFLRLHPHLRLPKTHWTRHGLIYGSVGSGKTVVLSQVVDQVMRRNLRALIYDVKGDYTQMFAHFPHVRVLCPWDDRSVRWDIAADVDTADRARAFANGLVPKGGDKDGPWNAGTADIITGVLISLQHELGTQWGWPELARRLMLGQPELFALLEKHHPNAARLISNPTSASTSSMLMNLSAYISLVVDLAQAWPDSSSPGFSWRRWVAARPLVERQILIQPGPDRTMSGALIAAMINVISEAIVSPELPDDEMGRSLFFLFDELTSIGRFDLPTLIDKGRSKGAMVWCGLQDLAQMRAVYGPDIAKALVGMVGTHVVCQIQMSETRREIAELFGYRRIANLLPSQSFGKGGTSASLAVKDESRAVVDASDLTDDLGARRGPQYPDGFAVRAIVSIGSHPLTLEWIGKKWPKPNPARVPARWNHPPVIRPQTWRTLHGIEGADKPTADSAQTIHALVQGASRSRPDWRAALRGTDRPAELTGDTPC